MPGPLWEVLIHFSILILQALFHREKLRHEACECALKSRQHIRANTHSQVPPILKPTMPA